MLLRFPNKNLHKRSQLGQHYSQGDLERDELHSSDEATVLSRDSRKTSERALRMLGIREHSVQELTRKLLAKGHQEKLVHHVLEDLQDRGLISDQRFAESFVRSRIAKGQGPILICGELRSRGVSERIMEDVLTYSTEHWLQLAQDARDKRFGKRLLSESACQHEPNGNGIENGFSENDIAENGIEADKKHGAVEKCRIERREFSESESMDCEGSRENTQADWTRQARFLSRRGFPADIVYRVLEHSQA
ncbi:MAG: recombination regulator RecX [Pseudomonadales bacterium]|nr:recombination regulator RecX [Pseudomonadales bacterium]